MRAFDLRAPLGDLAASVRRANEALAFLAGVSEQLAPLLTTSSLLDRLRSGHLPGWLGRMLFSWAQRTTERRHSAIRKRLLHSDESLQDLLAFSGRGE